MTTHRSLVTAVSLALGVALLATSVGDPATAARRERRNQREPRAEPEVSASVISTVRGDRHRLAKARVARSLTRISDAAGDQLTPAGEPVVDAPGWTDMAAVYTAPFRLTRKMDRNMRNSYPLGSAGTFLGPDADWSIGDRGHFVIVELTEPRPDDAISQLVEVGVDGADAGPVQVGSANDARAGVEQFTLGGRFNNGTETAGTTDIPGHAPGDAIELYNASSGIFGVYDRRDQRYLLLLPERRDARSLAISLRSVTDAGEIVDRLELPGGGHLVPLEDPGRGFKAADGALPLGCRAISTTSGGAAGAVGGPGATTTIRYTAGVGRDPETGEMPEANATFAALDGLDDVPMTLQRLDGESEPLEVDGRVTQAPALGTFSVSMDVPPGQWTFAPTVGEGLVTPDGEALIDHATLTGRAGVRTGDGLDGFVSGAAGCGRWDLGVAACELVPADGLATLVPGGDVALEHVEIPRPDGSVDCVGRIPDTRGAKYIVSIGRDYATSADLESAAEASGCSTTPVDLGSEGLVLDCALSGNFERFVFLVVPKATAARDADGGILVSVDLVVDPARAVGERYDAAAALGLIGGIADGLAASATPSGAPGGASS